jgi:arylsulfatase A-like enzyme
MAIRRRTLLSAAAAAAAAATLGCDNSRQDKASGLESSSNAGPQGPGQTGTTIGDKPNILLLCIDDLRDWVGYNSAHPGVYTPNIDQLRTQSYSFNRAYCSVPVCIASRGSALWGLKPDTVKLDGLKDDTAYWNLVNSANTHPLPHWFSRAGYETISTGKVFHLQRGTPRFWDVFRPYQDIPVSYGDHGTFFDYGVLDPGKMHIDQVSANFAVEQINTPRSKPWFMAIGLYQPHVPWRLPQWAFDLHPLDKVILPEVREDDLDDIPPPGVALAREPAGTINGSSYNQHDLVVESGLWRQHVQAYLAACSHSDAMVGQIIKALDASEYADNTAVVLWSDHGYHLGEKLHWRKMALWEQATRVPFLIRAPGLFEAGGGFDLPVSLLDLAPTLTDIAGIPRPGQFEGDSLVGISTEVANQRPAHMQWGDAISTRVGNWRWTRYAAGGEELYDLSVDPGEYNNLLGTTGRHKGGLAALL